MLHFGDVEDDVDNPPIETLQEKSELDTTTTTTEWLVLRFTRLQPCLSQFQSLTSKAC